MPRGDRSNTQRIPDQPARLAALVPGRGPLAGLILALLCAAVYLPGLAGIPPVDRDESRFAQASRQMFESAALPEADRDDALHSGGLVIPRVQGRDRLNKPPLIYWFQAGSAAVFTRGDPARDAIWMYRLPSVIAAAASVFVLWRLGLTMVTPRAAWLAAAFLAVCPMVVWDAHQARADQLLLACTTGSVFFLWRIYQTRTHAIARPARWFLAVGFWCCIALGILTKGPITPLVVVLAALGASLINRDWRWLARTKPLIGLALVVLLCAPWVIAVGQRVGWSDYLSLVLDETLGRSTTAKESHWGPPGYHLVLSAVLLWPGSLLTAHAIARTWQAAIRLPERESAGVLRFVRELPRRWMHRRYAPDADVFLIAWIVPSWIVFELVSTKLPHYVLPLYPALCLVSARAVIDLAGADAERLATSRLGLNIWLAIGAVLFAAGPVALAIVGGAGWLALAIACVAGTLAVILLLKARSAFDQLRFVRAQALSLLVAVIFVVTALGVVLPRTRAFFLSPRLVAAAEWSPGTPIASVHYHEDSLVFATRGELARIDADAARRWLAAHPRGVLIAPLETDFDLMTTSRRAEVRGINYAAGRVELLKVVERAR